MNRKLAGTRNTDADALRAGLDGRGKRDVLRAQEKALADVQAGEPVDVSGVLQDSPAVSRQVPSPDGEQASVRPDWSVERQDAAEPAPAEPVTEDAARQADKQSMEAGMAEVDARMEQLERQGLITEDDRAALKPYDDDVARAENAGEAGLGVVECVIRAAE